MTEATVNKDLVRVRSTKDMGQSFGFQQIDQSEKQSRVNRIFHSVAHHYDLMNDLMSGGMHRLWKDAFLCWLSPPRYPGWKLLDVAGGTGDVAFRAMDASSCQIQVTVLDINGSMLAVGRERAARKGLVNGLDFVEANAESLPFADNYFDAYTIAFGIRNIPHMEKALTEALRVLKPGGRFMCLEFSQVQMPLLDKIYDFWSFQAIPVIGEMIASDKDAYLYLIESIRKFPNQKDFSTIIEKAGFSQIRYRNLSGGIAAIHSAWKL